MHPALSKKGGDTPKNFILRITKEEWMKQVFTIKKYYPGVPRHWREGGLIFFARGSERGDSIIGYGVVEKFIDKEKLRGRERSECEKMGWRGAIVFSELYKFDPPLLIKETILGGLRAKGKYLHGYPLTEQQVNEILETARASSNIVEA
ncbi:hypothetical protein KEJ29_05870 [Candidatus Bathyarchaeota archaeon]|nr:hypothetical protein [Candidatus Bathyarchaeota archaeon]